MEPVRPTWGWTLPRVRVRALEVVGLGTHWWSSQRKRHHFVRGFSSLPRKSRCLGGALDEGALCWIGAGLSLSPRVGNCFSLIGKRE